MFHVNRNYRMSVSNVGLKRQEGPFGRRHQNVFNKGALNRAVLFKFSAAAIRIFLIKAHSTAPSSLKIRPRVLKLFTRH